MGFNTQPPEGGWLLLSQQAPLSIVSTHSRPKAAVERPVFATWLVPSIVSTHSRPKAAGETVKAALISGWFQHTAARRRLEAQRRSEVEYTEFQHTAARRRLPFFQEEAEAKAEFQHTAARRRLIHTRDINP